MANSDYVIHWFCFVFAFVLGILTALSTYRFWQKRKKYTFIVARRPSIPLAYCVLSVILLFTIFPALVLTDIAHEFWSDSKFHELNFSIEIIHECVLLCLLFFILIRTWILFYDHKWAEAMVDQKWRATINANEGNFWIDNRRSKWADPQSLMTIVVVLCSAVFVLFTAYQFIFPLTNDSHLAVMIILTRFGVGLPTVIVLLTFMRKINKLHDQFFIRKEMIALTGVIIADFFRDVVMVYVEAIRDIHHKVDAYMYFTDMIIVFSMAIIQSYWVIRIGERQMRSLKVLSIMKSQQWKNCGMEHILRSHSGFQCFMRHCQSELNVENILFIVEIAQFKAMVAKAANIDTNTTYHCPNPIIDLPGNVDNTRRVTPYSTPGPPLFDANSEDIHPVSAALEVALAEVITHHSTDDRDNNRDDKERSRTATEPSMPVGTAKAVRFMRSRSADTSAPVSALVDTQSDQPLARGSPPLKGVPPTGLTMLNSKSSDAGNDNDAPTTPNRRKIKPPNRGRTVSMKDLLSRHDSESGGLGALPGLIDRQSGSRGWSPSPGTSRSRGNSVAGNSATKGDIYKVFANGILKRTWLPIDDQFVPKPTPHNADNSKKSKEESSTQSHTLTSGVKKMLKKSDESSAHSKDSETSATSGNSGTQTLSAGNSGRSVLPKPQKNAKMKKIYKKLKQLKRGQMQNEDVFEYGKYLFDKYLDPLSSTLTVNIRYATLVSLMSLFQTSPDSTESTTMIISDITTAIMASYLYTNDSTEDGDENRALEQLVATYLYHAFDEAFEEIWELLRSDVFFRFRNTKYFIRWLNKKRKNHSTISTPQKQKEKPKQKQRKPRFGLSSASSGSIGDTIGGSMGDITTIEMPASTHINTILSAAPKSAAAAIANHIHNKKKDSVNSVSNGMRESPSPQRQPTTIAASASAAASAAADDDNNDISVDRIP